MSKRPRGDASTTSGAMPAAKETYVDPSAVMDPTGHSEDVNPLRVLFYHLHPLRTNIAFGNM